MQVQAQMEVLQRLKGIEGHLNGVAHMVKEDRDVSAILQQMRAIQGALKQISMLLVKQHVDCCLGTLCGKSNEAERQQVHHELFAVLEQT